MTIHFQFMKEPEKSKTIIMTHAAAPIYVGQYKRHLNTLCSFNKSPVSEAHSKKLGHVTFVPINESKTDLDWQNIGLSTGHKIRSQETSHWQILLYKVSASHVNLLAVGIAHALAQFDTYKTSREPKNIEINFICDDPEAYANQFQHTQHLIDGQQIVKDLANAPGNKLTPEIFTQKVKDLFQGLDCKIQSFDMAAMKKLKMNALIGVGKGSENDPFFVTLEWQGNPKSQTQYALAGKGVTFDSGGISLKPPLRMHEMKYDMTGAATVVGLIYVACKNKLPINIVVGIGLAENMPSSKAEKPGDVIETMSGKTVEILNTDAEGRLVLADVLYYLADTYKPTALIDVATLTGACIVALGHYYAAVFSNNSELSHELQSTGELVGEKLWTLPLHPGYDHDIKSKIADLSNIGYNGGGSCTGAQFLAHFTKEIPWAHIDIAGTAWVKSSYINKPTGPSSFGVHLLYQWLLNKV